MRFSVLALFLIPAPLLAQGGRRPLTVDDRFRLAEPGTPPLSPDGQWVLYTVERASLAENARHSVTWLASSRGKTRPREFLREGDSSPMWAAGSRSVFFLRSVGDGDKSSREIFEQPLDGEAVQRSHIGPGPGASWQLSADGAFFLAVRQEATPSGPGADTDVVYVNEGSNGQVRDYWRNLWRYDLATGTFTRVTRRDWWIWTADLSPDGASAIVAAQPDNALNTQGKTELYLVDLKTGSARQITDNTVPELTPQWSPDGRSVLFSAVRLDKWELGNGDLWLLDVASGTARNVAPGRTGRFGTAVFSPDGKSLFVQSGYGTTRFPVRIDVATGRITPLMKTDGVVRVGSWSADRRTYAYAYTDAFMQANRFDLGGGDRLDIMAGVDAMIARGVADPQRLAIDGWPYGGILGGYTITQTDRFKAASLGAMVSDWTAEYAGSYSAFERWLLGGDRWTNERPWRDRSPLTHADKVKTPTILHHGDLDDTDAVFHSLAFHAALRKFGVEARLLRYPNEGHDLRQPYHIQLRDAEDAAWFRRFAPP